MATKENVKEQDRSEDRSNRKQDAHPLAPRNQNDMSYRERLEERNKDRVDAFNKNDSAARDIATGRPLVDDLDLRDKLLALGADVTRASPDPHQYLPDADPGLTTTTGSHRTPIDPTTAAVPAPQNSKLVERTRGVATAGSSGPGEAEELFKKRDMSFLEDDNDDDRSAKDDRSADKK